MTFKELAKKITEVEGKKKQVNIAQVSEILKGLKRLYKEDAAGILEVLVKK